MSKAVPPARGFTFALNSAPARHGDNIASPRFTPLRSIWALDATYSDPQQTDVRLWRKRTLMSGNRTARYLERSSAGVRGHLGWLPT